MLDSMGASFRLCSRQERSPKQRSRPISNFDDTAEAAKRNSDFEHTAGPAQLSSDSELAAEAAQPAQPSRAVILNVQPKFPSRPNPAEQWFRVQLRQPSRPSSAKQWFWGAAEAAKLISALSCAAALRQRQYKTFG